MVYEIEKLDIDDLNCFIKDFNSKYPEFILSMDITNDYYQPCIVAKGKVNSVKAAAIEDLFTNEFNEFLRNICQNKDI